MRVSEDSISRPSTQREGTIPGFEVYKPSIEEWEIYVRLECQATKSRGMNWQN
jgi:hypothetical protein